MRLPGAGTWIVFGGGVRVAGWIVSALVVLEATALAEESAGASGLQLTWRAPAGCPSVEDVRSATLRDVSQSGTGDSALEVDAEVEERPVGRFRVHLRTKRGSVTGEREIEAASCEGVAEATAVLLALALGSDPNAEEDHTASPKAVERTTVPARPPPPTSADERPHAFALGIGAAADVSSLPSPALGGSLILAWMPGRFRLEADARRWLAQSASVSGSQTGARFSMTSLGGRGCLRILARSALELSPCGGADIHLVSAPGFGADENYSASANWTAITGGALLRLSLVSWLAVRARAEVLVPLARPAFVVENEGGVHRSPTLGAAANLGIEALFL